VIQQAEVLVLRNRHGLESGYCRLLKVVVVVEYVEVCRTVKGRGKRFVFGRLLESLDRLDARERK
jgi:hypothetical protein